MKRFDVIAAGLMVMDIIAAPVDCNVFESDTVYPEHMTFCTGGDMLNAAFNLAKLDARVALAGALGDDDAGHMILRHIKRLGLDHESVTLLPDVNTPVSLVLCETGGERHFIHKPGANDRFDAAQLSAQRLAEARILYLGSSMALPMLEGQALRGLFERAKAAGVLTVMDATASRDGRWLEKVEAALDVTDVFFPSFFEAELITGEREPEGQVKFFEARGVKLSGVKLGADGCIMRVGGQTLRVPAIPHACPVDLTGAGDAFMAGFMKGMLMGWAPVQCARLGSAVAHSCIGSIGATSHVCTFEQLLAVVERNYPTA